MYNCSRYEVPITFRYIGFGIQLINIIQITFFFFILFLNSISISTIVGKIVVHFETNKSVHQSPDGIYLAIGLITVLLTRSILYNSFDMTISHIAMKIRVATCNIIYKKVHYNIIYTMLKHIQRTKIIILLLIINI